MIIVLHGCFELKVASRNKTFQFTEHGSCVSAWLQVVSETSLHGIARNASKLQFYSVFRKWSRTEKGHWRKINYGRQSGQFRWYLFDTLNKRETCGSFCVLFVGRSCDIQFMKNRALFWWNRMISYVAELIYAFCISNSVKMLFSPYFLFSHPSKSRKQVDLQQC